MLARVLLPLLFAVSAYAADPFISRLGDSATALKSGDYAKALKIDERLIDDMVERLGPGDAESKWFAVAVLHKAVALAGLGRNDDAVWYWHVALNIYPAIAESDMSMFGAPAGTRTSIGPGGCAARNFPAAPYADMSLRAMAG